MQTKTPTQTLADWPLDRIDVNPWQPRTTFDVEELNSLGASMKTHGQLHPGLARPKPGDESRVQLLDGERRFRTLEHITAETMTLVIRNFTDKEMAEAAIASNRDRVGNNPIELARAYRRLQDEFGVTAEEIAQRSGKSRPVVANLLRLLDLPPEVQDLVGLGQLSEAHGRALAGYNDFPPVAAALAQFAVKESWPSKALEKWPPLTYEQRQTLWKAELIVTLPYHRDRVFKMCDKCPFKAFRKGLDGNGICLKPDHYAELKAAYQAEVEAERNNPQQGAIEKQKKEQERAAYTAAQNAKVAATGARNAQFADIARDRLDATRKRSMSEDSIEEMRAEILLVFVNVAKSQTCYVTWMAKARDRWGISLDIQAISEANYGESRTQMVRDAAEQLRTSDLLLLLAESAIEGDTHNSYQEARLTPNYVSAQDDDFELPVL